MIRGQSHQKNITFVNIYLYIICVCVYIYIYIHIHSQNIGAHKYIRHILTDFKRETGM